MYLLQLKRKDCTASASIVGRRSSLLNATSYCKKELCNKGKCSYLKKRSVKLSTFVSHFSTISKFKKEILIIKLLNLKPNVSTFESVDYLTYINCNHFCFQTKRIGYCLQLFSFTVKYLQNHI